jgi:hypothetical protein
VNLTQNLTQKLALGVDMSGFNTTYYRPLRRQLGRILQDALCMQFKISSLATSYFCCAVAAHHGYVQIYYSKVQFKVLLWFS